MPHGQVLRHVGDGFIVASIAPNQMAERLSVGDESEIEMKYLPSDAGVLVVDGQMVSQMLIGNACINYSGCSSGCPRVCRQGEPPSIGHHML